MFLFLLNKKQKKMEQNKPLVAVVIIHWNRKQLLEKFLPALTKSTYPNLKIILADNNSKDRSTEWVKQNFPHIQIIKNNENYGYAGGYNRALLYVQADYYVLLNNDVEVTPDWIEPIIDVVENDKSIAAAQPKIIDYNNQTLFEYAGAAGGYMDYLGYAFCRGRIFEKIETDTNQYNSIQKVFWVSGACMFIRSEVFRSLDGFDEYFFAHMEEIDLCWRMQLKGYNAVVVPQSKVYHVGGGTLSKQSPYKTYLNFRNSLIMLTKNLPISTLIWLIPVRSTLDLISSIYFLINGFPRYSASIHKAHAQYFFKFSKWWKLREQNNSVKPIKKLSSVYKRSIVFEHFIKRNSIFSKLNKKHFNL